MFEPFLDTSILGRARKNGLVEVCLTNIRDFAVDNYGSVDDKPYGGGPGMVMQCQPVFDAVEHVRSITGPSGKVVMLTPQGKPLDQQTVEEFSRMDRLILLAGHYEGFDERIRQSLADNEISIGDYVLSGGETAAMVLTDAIVRLLPGALGKDESTGEESFQDGLLEYPQYTRPREYREMEVPEVLLNGNHAEIREWRKRQSKLRTQERRKDLWGRYLQNKND
jgi:tRNA (guanine37-N1)-methyltransferase